MTISSTEVEREHGNAVPPKFFGECCSPKWYQDEEAQWYSSVPPCRLAKMPSLWSVDYELCQSLKVPPLSLLPLVTHSSSSPSLPPLCLVTFHFFGWTLAVWQILTSSHQTFPHLSDWFRWSTDHLTFYSLNSFFVLVLSLRFSFFWHPDSPVLKLTWLWLAFECT